MEKGSYEVEWRLNRFHWWFVGRRRLIRSLLSRLDIRRDSTVLDIGCGVGSNLSLLRLMGFNVIGIDSEIYALSLARKNVSAVPLVNGDLVRLPILTNSIGLIVATDVLEHLGNDALGLQEIYRTLERGGKVLITVPAFNFLWGIQDDVSKHKRRYSKKHLLEEMEQQGFKILGFSYFNFFLFFPILLIRRLMHLFEIRVDSENVINSPLLNHFIKIIFSMEPYFLTFLTFPFGVSIFCLAEK
jgi:SAM-dependent methyltransferase